jgi:hypothetical protein
MIDIQIPVSNEYNTANANSLAKEITNLHSFDEAADWSKKAISEVETMHNVLRTIEGKQQTVAQALLRENQEHEAKSFLARSLDGRKEQRRWLAEQSRLKTETAKIDNLIKQFESAIDFIPKSPNDQKELIKECKQKKKELQTEKKAVNVQMTSIRVDARQQRATALSGKIGSSQRRSIRLNEENALRPQENQKAAIDRQIVNLDQIIIWLERFK